MVPFLHVSSFPAAYIKAYLLENGVCIAKKKTKVARKSLDPLYNQVLLFAESPQGKVLQVREEVSSLPSSLFHLCWKILSLARGLDN